MASYSAQALINEALTNIGMLEQGGSPSVSDSNNALTKLNLMIEQWRIRDTLIWSVGKASYALTAAQAAYPIGPTATAPFNVARPDYIETALIGYPGPNSAKQITRVLPMISEQEYAAIRDLNAAANIPERLYNDRASPNSTLYLWPTPRVTVATNLILFTWAQIPSFASLVTSNDLTEGYAAAISWQLAVWLLPSFGVAVVSEVAQNCLARAQESIAIIEQLNSRARSLMAAQPQPAAAGAAR